MEGFQEFERNWQRANESALRGIVPEELNKMIRLRTRRQVNRSMGYFWKSLVYHILVYALLCNTIARHWDQVGLVALCLVGIATFVPFTTILVKRFRALATAGPTYGERSAAEVVAAKERVLSAFFRFKQRYELFLVPLSCAIGTVVVFNLYVPGGTMSNLNLALMTFMVALGSCAYALFRENKSNFREPLKELRSILGELQS